MKNRHVRSTSWAISALLSLAPAAWCAGESALGDWIGAYQQNGRWTLIRAEFQAAGEGLQGKLDVLQPAYHQAIQPQTKLSDVKRSESSMHFHHVSPAGAAPRDVTFDGILANDSIDGQARGAAGWSGPFHLFRTRLIPKAALREYHGVYQLGPNEFLYVMTWNEVSGADQLVALNDTGELRTLYPVEGDRFFSGPGAAYPIAVESSIEFQRNGKGAVSSLTWRRGGETPRSARRLDSEKEEDVTFASGDIRLAGTLTSPKRPGKHPAVILVHGSGPEDRGAMLPFARFLVGRGMAVFGYDKRGVGGSTGDWNTASFEDLGDDAVAAFNFLKTRSDIDSKQIGMLGISQASGVMPIAIARAPGVAFLISISGGGVPSFESDLNYQKNEMRLTGYSERAIAEAVEQTNLLNEYLRTGEGWEKWIASLPPGTTVPDRNDPSWKRIRSMAFHDSVPLLEKLRLPTLAIWGGLDIITSPDRSRPIWEGALKRAGNSDYNFVVLPKADHDMLEAETGSSAEMPRLQRIVPEYFTAVRAWLKAHIPGFDGSE